MMMMLVGQSAFLFKSIFYLSTNSPKRSRIFQIKKLKVKVKSTKEVYNWRKHRAEVLRYFSQNLKN